MRKAISAFLTISLLMALSVSVYAAPPDNLTWDGKPATLDEIDRNCGYEAFYRKSMGDGNGNYNPDWFWYDLAKELWEKGLFLGSNGSFDLDNPLTRAEGVVMTIRLLGKEAEAKATAASVTFTDVPDWAKSYIAYAVQNGIANGYNETTFGASDAMTAAQFITLTLRAMGYKDGEDFTWDKSYDKALEIKLFGKCEYEQYSRSNLFMRDDAVGIAYNAVLYTPTKSGSLLKDTITMPGKPAGNVPTATRTGGGTQAPPADGSDPNFSGWEIIHGDDHFQIHSLPGGNYNAVATYYLYFGEFAGNVDVKVTISPTAVGETATTSLKIEHMPGGGYSKLFLGFNLAPADYGQKVTNTIRFQVGDYVYTDTVSVNGTLYSVKFA